METLTLIDLPVEMLFEIIKHVPNKNQMSLVCKKLYRALWSYDGFFQLELKSRDLVEEQKINTSLFLKSFYF